MKLKKSWIFVLLLIVCMVGIGIYFVVEPSEPLLKEVEVEQLIRDKYAGTISHMDEQTDRYQVDFRNSTGLYRVQILKDSGKVVSLTQLERVEPSPEKNQTPSSNTDRTLPVEQAKQLALRQVPGGEVIEVELEEESGILQYEILLFNQEQRETEVYVNAYTGDILSIVTSDDDDDDDDD